MHLCALSVLNNRVRVHYIVELYQIHDEQIIIHLFPPQLFKTLDYRTDHGWGWGWHLEKSFCFLDQYHRRVYQ